MNSPRPSRRVLLAGAAAAVACPAEAVTPSPAVAVPALPPAGLPDGATFELAYRQAFHGIWLAAKRLELMIVDRLGDFPGVRADDALWLHATARGLESGSGWPVRAPSPVVARAIRKGLLAPAPSRGLRALELTDRGDALVARIDLLLQQNARYLRYVGPSLADLDHLQSPLAKLEREWKDIYRYRL